MSDIHIDCDYTWCQNMKTFNKQYKRILKAEDTHYFQYVEDALLHEEHKFIEFYCSRALSCSRDAINSDVSHTCKLPYKLIWCVNDFNYHLLFFRNFESSSKFSIWPQEVRFLSAELQHYVIIRPSGECLLMNENCFPVLKILVMVHSQIEYMEKGHQIWMIATNVLNEQPLIANKEE